MSEVNDLPDLTHWKHVKEFSLNEAALLLAGIDPLDYDMQAIHRKATGRWKIAIGMLRAIKSSIRQGSLAVQVAISIDYNGNAFECSPTSYENVLDDDLTIITRASLLGWIEREKIDFVRPPSTKQIKPTEYHTTQQNPAKQILNTHHRSRGIDLIEIVDKQFYSSYDPENKDTAPRKEEVVNYLNQKHGASKNLASAVDVVMRPDEVKSKGRPRKNGSEF
jgi:hypothetical protein